VNRTRTAPVSALSAVLAAVLVVVLGACAHIPDSGSVRTGDVNAPDSGEIYVQAYGPTAGAAPLDIVTGFLRAQAAGVVDGYVVAKQFLTEGAADVWDPTGRTTVYAGEPTFAASPTPDDEADDGSAGPTSGAGPDSTDAGGGTGGAALAVSVVTGTITLSAILSSDGVLTEAGSNATQDLSFSLTQVSGQWRIDKVDNGTYVSLPNFTSTYRAVSLQFLSTDNAYLVPDVRWYPQRNVATYAITGLLAGPVSWLRDSVHSVIPDGTTLAISAVSVDSDGEATVDLSSGFLGISTADRALARAQVEATLRDIPEVRTVRFQADGATISMPPAATPVSDPIVADAPTLLVDGKVGTLSDGSFVADPAVGAPGNLVVTSLAVEPDVTASSSRVVVVRSGRSRLAVLGSGGVGSSARVVLTADGIVEPSVDRYGWIWTATSAEGLVAVNDSGTAIYVSVPWLEGRTTSALRVSHDGARIVVVSSGPSGNETRVELAGVVRDKSGAPTALSTATAIGAPVVSASRVVWVDEADVAVLGKVAAAGTAAVQLVPLAGWTQSQANVDGARTIAAGRGARSLYVLTSDGVLFGRGTTGVNWLQVLTGVTAVAYPG